MSLEETKISDSSTGRHIRISTTVRLMYRKAYPDEYGHLRNARLNQIIARDFVANSSNILHYFRLGKKDKSQADYQPPGAEKGKVYSGTGEIRGSSSFYFISAIKDDSIDILTVQASWLKPKYKGSESDPIEMGDS